MNDILLYSIIGVAAVILILLILVIAGKGDQVKKILGPIGILLVGLVAAFAVSKATSSSKREDEIREENERIKAEREKLKKEFDDLNAEMEKARDEFEAEDTRLEEIKEKVDAKREELKAAIDKEKEMDNSEWLNSLSEEERKKILGDIDSEITDVP